MTKVSLACELGRLTSAAVVVLDTRWTRWSPVASDCASNNLWPLTGALPLSAVPSAGSGQELLEL